MSKSVANTYFVRSASTGNALPKGNAHHSDDSSSESDFEFVGPGENSLLSSRPEGSLTNRSHCVNCGEEMDTKSSQRHQCPSSVVDCDFKQVGCDVMLPRREMASHLKESVVAHLSLQVGKFEGQLDTLKTENEALIAKCESLEEKCKHVEMKIDEIHVLLNSQAKIKHRSKDSLEYMGNGTNLVYSSIMTQDVIEQNCEVDLEMEPDSYLKLSPAKPVSVKDPVCDPSSTFRAQMNVHASEISITVDNGEYVNADEMPTPLAKTEGNLEVLDYSYVFTAPPLSPSRKSSVGTLLPLSANLVMNNFEEHKLSNDQWVSQPFYTHEQGYKMCLKVTANGQGSGKGSHITVVVYLMKGEYDDQLEWPFKADVTSCS